MIIEVSGGLITNIIATDAVSIYLIDHDDLKATDDMEHDLLNAKQAMQPYGIVSDEQEFFERLDEALDGYKINEEVSIPIELSNEEWAEVYYAVELKHNHIIKGFYDIDGKTDTAWAAQLGGIMDKISDKVSV